MRRIKITRFALSGENEDKGNGQADENDGISSNRQFDPRRERAKLCSHIAVIKDACVPLELELVLLDSGGLCSSAFVAGAKKLGPRLLPCAHLHNRISQERDLLPGGRATQGGPFGVNTTRELVDVDLWLWLPALAAWTLERLLGNRPGW